MISEQLHDPDPSSRMQNLPPNKYIPKTLQNNDGQIF